MLNQDQYFEIFNMLSYKFVVKLQLLSKRFYNKIVPVYFEARHISETMIDVHPHDQF